MPRSASSTSRAARALAAVASRTGVAPPSLYKHIGGLGDLRTLVRGRVLAELTERFAAAVIGRSGDNAVTSLLRAYRDYVRAQPARYAAMPPDPLHDPALAAAGRQQLDIVFAVRGYGLEGGAAVHAARCLRSIAHGFVSIEASGGFGMAEDVNETYEQLIHMFLATLPHSVDR